MDRLDEESIDVGDVFDLGQARIQATMPRFPCFLMAARLEVETAAELIHESRQPGILFRVLTPGLIAAGDELKRVARAPVPLKILDFFEMVRGRKISRRDLEYLKTVPALPSALIQRFESWV